MLNAKPDVQLGINVDHRKQGNGRWLNIDVDILNLDIQQRNLRWKNCASNIHEI